MFLFIDVGARAIAAPTATWATPRHIASLLNGERALDSAGVFDPGIVVYGLLLELAVRRLRMPQALVAGVLFGCLLDVVNYYVMTGVFTSFVAVRGTIASRRSSASALRPSWATRRHNAGRARRHGDSPR